MAASGSNQSRKETRDSWLSKSLANGLHERSSLRGISPVRNRHPNAVPVSYMGAIPT